MNQSPIPQSCHNYISSPAFITDIDVAHGNLIIGTDNTASYDLISQNVNDCKYCSVINIVVQSAADYRRSNVILHVLVIIETFIQQKVLFGF